MREDFDYVTMENYSADMAELSGTAARAIEALRKQNDEAKRLIAMLVIAAGGQIDVPTEWWYDPSRDITTAIEINPATREHIFRARWQIRRRVDGQSP